MLSSILQKKSIKYYFNSTIKWLIASKLIVFVYNICVYTVYIYYVCINTNTCMYIFNKIHYVYRLNNLCII